VPRARAADAMSVDPATLSYDREGLVACICQDAATGDVLMLAWANRDAVERTLATGRAWFWSRSRGELWDKGATSGNALALVELRADCDRDALLYRVLPSGPACHTGDETCWGERTTFPAALARTILERRAADPAASYVARLLGGPREHAARKVGEEATEVLLAVPGSDEQVGEIADLVFHALVLLARDGRDPLDVFAELARRHAAG
jgi:phosphoribosyl-AMP cyclohydrolase / phosphoribosyl-ATP pyrophosphohydrolase